jgi:acyl-CoA synthetase (AMP-forming)/AMP-acid ligase II
MVVPSDSIADLVAVLATAMRLPGSVAFADALPMSGAGKILKRELRNTYWDATDRNVS